jgi:UDP-glucose 4-epimerase
MVAVIVTGGAGYIGSHAAKRLAESGYRLIVVDNVRTGWREAVKYGPLEEADILDNARLKEVFSKYKPAAVMHFAALSDVGESMRRPELYFRNNIVGSLNLLDVARETGCSNIVFSSTCATYGESDGKLLTEEHPQAPVNPYGTSNTVQLMY